VDDEPFARLFREKVFALLQRRGRIDDRIVRQMRGWRHSGFSVDRSVRLAAASRVPTPAPNSSAASAGTSRSSGLLDFLAEVTQHVPDPWEHLVRY